MNEHDLVELGKMYVGIIEEAAASVKEHGPGDPRSILLVKMAQIIGTITDDRDAFLELLRTGTAPMSEATRKALRDFAALQREYGALIKDDENWSHEPS